MARKPAQVAWPVFGSRDSWCVDYELVRRLVQRCRRLKCGHIRPMSKLCLCIAADHVYVLDLGDPHGFLLLTRKVLDREAEHGDLEPDSGQKTLEILLPVDIRRRNHWLREDKISMLLPEHIDAAPEVLLHLMRRHIIELDSVLDALIGTERITDVLPEVETLLAPVQENSELLLIKGTFGPFFKQVW